MTMLSFTDEQLESLKKWDAKLPRFLFRGFHEASGARAHGTASRHELEDIGSLNTKKYIIPYAFRPKGKDIMSKLMHGAEDKRPTTRNLISGHVFNCSGPDEDCPVWGPTPFSSWTPDLHTALAFSRLVWSTDENDKPTNFDLRQYPRIAVLDTHLLSRQLETRDVRVFHMKALADIFSEPAWDLRSEYLVHGKVHGPAFQVVCTDSIQAVAHLAGSCWWQPYKGLHSEPVYRHDLREDEVSKARQVAKLFATDGDNQPDRIIAVMAAELARLQWDTGMPIPYPKPIGLDLTWETHDVDLVVENVTNELQLLAQAQDFQRTLVNARQCAEALPNVGMMVEMLMSVEAKIPGPRSPTASEKLRRNKGNRITKPARKRSIAKKILNKMRKKD